MRYTAIFTFLICFSLGSLTLRAQTTRNVEYLSSTDIRKAASGPNTGPDLRSTILHTGDVYRYMLARRTGPGQVEVHASMDDIFQVQEGEATLLYGGKQIGGKEDKPGEFLGGKIEGGKVQELTAGDVIMIPAKMPHQLLIKKGDTFIYFVTKVKRP